MVRQKTDLRIHEEISVLQKKLSETDIQLTEEKKTQVRLTNEAKTKVRELNTVLRAIEEEENSFAEDVRAVTRATQTVQKENKDRLKALNATKASLEHHISASDTMQRENQYLRLQIVALTRDHEENARAHEEEREKIKQRNFDARMTMEAVLRKEIQTLDTNFKVLAIQAMNDEAVTASNENQGLYAELSRREDLSRSMISEQQSSYEDLQRITIEHEVMITAADYYENIIRELGRVAKKQESKEKRLKMEKEKIQETVTTYDDICKEKCAQAQHVLALHAQYEQLQQSNTRARKDCIRACQRALQRSIARASEQTALDGQQLTVEDQEQEEQDLEEQQQLARADAQTELVSVDVLLSPPCQGQQQDRRCPAEENYDAMWMSSAVKFPQLTGAIRRAMLSDERLQLTGSFGDKKKSRKKLLAPRVASASMTNHI